MLKYSYSNNLSMEDLKATIRKYALHNAVKYEGKANQGAVLGRILGEMPDLRNKIKDVAKQIAEIVRDVNSIKVDSQFRELEKIAPELLKEEKKEEEKKLPVLKNAVQDKVLQAILRQIDLKDRGYKSRKHRCRSIQTYSRRCELAKQQSYL